MKVKAKVKLYPHQYKYVMCKHPRPAIVAGYGAGKTYSNVRRTLRLLEMRKGKAFIFYAAPTYDLIYSTYYIELIDTLMLYGIKYHEDKAHHSIIIDTPELRGTIKLISMERYVNLIGFTATDGILDEFDTLSVKRQKEVWKRALARLRGCDNGTLSITTTPEGYKLVYELWKAGQIEQITASSEDNKSLPDSFIQDMYDCYDDAHIQMYIKGNYVNLAGLRAMYNFKAEHLLDPVDISKLPHRLTVGMDFNVDPFCMTVSYTDANGCKITFDEFYIRNAAGCDGYASFTDKAMNMLLAKYPNQEFVMQRSMPQERIYDVSIRPDMTGSARKTQSNITDINIIRKYGCQIVGTHNPLVSARLKIANMAMANGLWKVTKNCVNLIKDMELCVTDEYGELMKDDKDRTHILDAATYDVYQDYKHLLFKPRKVSEI